MGPYCKVLSKIADCVKKAQYMRVVHIDYWIDWSVHSSFLVKHLQLLRGYRTLLLDGLKLQQLVSHKSGDRVLIKIIAPVALSVTGLCSPVFL